MAQQSPLQAVPVIELTPEERAAIRHIRRIDPKKKPAGGRLCIKQRVERALTLARPAPLPEDVHRILVHIQAGRLVLDDEVNPTTLLR